MKDPKGIGSEAVGGGGGKCHHVLRWGEPTHSVKRGENCIQEFWCLT